MPSEPSRKPCEKPAPYKQKPKTPVVKDVPKTAAKQVQIKKWENLTLQDWMTVFAYIDKHPGVSQSDIVAHFASKVEGALHFSQGTLSRKMKSWSSLDERVTSNMNALSSKHPCIVTWPDVERALVLWVKTYGGEGDFRSCDQVWLKNYFIPVRKD
ncbi:hypothetical protein K439DRAFT_1375931 [Ramaria rubella]|nr:hypothetical protein K439DRAFT_1375931 [Ramaria rubella]